MAQKSKIIKFEDLKQENITANALLIFGGTFDPVHEGHISVIRRLQPYFKKILLAPTSQNPWKEERSTNLELRIEMLELALKAEELKVEIYREGYTYTKEICETFSSETIYWAIGEDLTESVSSWKDWDELGITAVIVPFTEMKSATQVRDGEIEAHPALKGFIRERELY